MTDRELMQMALDAATEELPKVDERETVFCSIQGHHLRALCEFVCAALAQPEPEPVAWLDPDMGAAYTSEELPGDDNAAHGFEPLYTAPPQREWQGLADETYWEMWVEWPSDVLRFAHAIEAKLKEKNT